LETSGLPAPRHSIAAALPECLPKVVSKESTSPTQHFTLVLCWETHPLQRRCMLSYVI
jgi:hypothetical protein